MTDQAKSANTLKDDLLYLLMKLAFLAILLFIMLNFVFAVVRVSDMSMKPAVMEGDLVVSYRLQKDYKSGDLVVCKDGKESQIRRVVAIEGDTVDITESGLVINGNLQQEKSIYFETKSFVEGISFPVTVPQGEIFVLGDNRSSAEDSRIYGAIKTSETKGKVVAFFRRRNF